MRDSGGVLPWMKEEPRASDGSETDSRRGPHGHCLVAGEVVEL